MKCHGEELQKRLTGLQEWAANWWMSTSAKKCCVPTEKQSKPYLHAAVLKTVHENSGKTSWSPHWEFSEIFVALCATVVKNADKMLVMTKSVFENKTEGVILLLRRILMHSHIE